MELLSHAEIGAPDFRYRTPVPQGARSRWAKCLVPSAGGGQAGSRAWSEQLKQVVAGQVAVLVGRMIRMDMVWI